MVNAGGLPPAPFYGESEDGQKGAKIQIDTLDLFLRITFDSELWRLKSNKKPIDDFLSYLKV
jgi:hypothetical protein